MKAKVQPVSVLSKLQDDALIQLVLSGQQHACTVLVRRHERLLRFIVQRYLTDPEAVQEVVQDTFLRAFRALPGFRGDSKFSTWLCKIAASQAISRLRSRRYAAWDSIEETLLRWEADLQDCERSLEKQEANELLRQAVRQLKPNDATTIELFYFSEQSVAEIGRITGWTSTNIKSRLSRARQRLRNELEKRNLKMEYYS